MSRIVMIAMVVILMLLPASSVIAQAPTGTPAPTKCEWLATYFPQSTEGVQALGAKLAGVSTQRVRTHLFRCDAVNTVFDGFVLLGPNEGYDGAVTLEVPVGGAIDSYPGAVFTGQTVRIGAETIRALDGKVTATTLTYWPWLDEAVSHPAPGTMPTPMTSGTPAPSGTMPTFANPADKTLWELFVILANHFGIDTNAMMPAGTPAPSATLTATVPVTGTVTMPTGTPEPTATPMACKTTFDLAKDEGWSIVTTSNDEFGGVVVNLTKSGTLPEMWMAQGYHVSIGEDDSTRDMKSGRWTVYPPYSCRDELGYSK